MALPSEPSPKELSFDEKIKTIQRYLPKGLTEKILSQMSKIEGERKQITVMFCDMEGFTPLVERFGPEEAYFIMDQVYEITFPYILLASTWDGHILGIVNLKKPLDILIDRCS